MQIKKLYILLFFLCFATALSSQNLISTIKSADIAFQDKNFYGAARLYEDALKFDNKMYDIHYKAAEAFRMDNDYVNAIKHYKIVCDRAASRFPLSVLYLAEMQKSDEDYFSAQFNFNKYYTTHKSDSTDYFTIKAKQEIVFCENAIKIKYNHTGVNIIALDTTINSLYSEIGASSWGDSVIFFSSVKPDSAFSNEFVSSIYCSVRRNGEWVNTYRLDTIINATGYHNASAFFSTSTSTLLFSRKGFGNDDKTRIFKTTYRNYEWETPVPLGENINDTSSNNTQATLAEFNGKTYLFFVSDRAKGLGGYDIWFSEMKDDFICSPPKLAGIPTSVDSLYLAYFGVKSVINSAGNELCPYFNYKDSCLYFSSDWFEGLGAYDIYKSKTNLIDWQEPVNLGYPINSSQNDLYYFIDNKSGFVMFTSNRKEARALKHQSCCNDIFMYPIDKEIDTVKIVEQQITTLTLEASELIPITLFFDNDHPNPNTWDTLTTINYTDAYNRYVEKEELFCSEFSKGYRGDEKDLLRDSVLNFFDYQVSSEYQKLLKFAALLKELVLKDQQIIITIKGYTSPLNTTEYNEALAKRRISSLINFFREYDDGFFLPYEASGKIIIQRVAFGETLAGINVSDDPNDRRNSVFSPLASAERKIRIIAVSVNE